MPNDSRTFLEYQDLLREKGLLDVIKQRPRGKKALKLKKRALPSKPSSVKPSPTKPSPTKPLKKKPSKYSRASTMQFSKGGKTPDDQSKEYADEYKRRYGEDYPEEAKNAPYKVIGRKIKKGKK